MSETPTVMHAAYVARLGPAENIEYGQIPVPVPGATDVLVAVDTVAVDPVDTPRPLRMRGQTGCPAANRTCRGPRERPA